MEKRTALGISLGLHTAFFAALMYSPTIPLKVPEKSPSEYQQEFAGKEDRIVWYHFRKLPEIRPPERKAQRRPLRAETKAEQAIVSSPKNAPKRQQVVIAPVPDIAPPPLDLPNLIAVKLPPKAFTTPPDLVRPEPAKMDAPDVPDAKYEPIAKAELPVDRLPSRAYVPPAPVQQKPAARIEMPAEAPSEAYEAKLVPSDIPSARLPSRKFVPPAAQKRAEAHRIQAIDEAAPSVTSPMASASLLPSTKLPVRAIATPTIDGPPGDVTMAIAGLKPSNVPVQLPAAASPAQFSAGEKVRPEGATSESSGKVAAVVSDLYARGPNAPAKPDLLAMSIAPRSTQALIDDMARRRQPNASFSESPGATRVNNAPDARFNGREVYMMAIQMANLTSASGSWLMWYSERTARSAATAPIAAPVPHRKVDPRYDPALIAEHVHGRVQLYGVIGRDGHVSGIEVLRGDDVRLDRSAEEALSKWEFYPATRNGEPVDVDVVVEIPFVIAPPPLK
jgi:TonB family protein